MVTALAERAEWIQGPGLVVWLESHGLFSPDIQLGFHARRIRHWREGKTADLHTADIVLTKLGLHLSEIPDELWLEEAPKARRYTDKDRKEMARRLGEGQTVTAVARSFCCHRETVLKAAERFSVKAAA